MKTTLDINDDLFKAAKQQALDTGSTLRQVVETALAQHLKLHKPAPLPIKTVTFGSSASSLKLEKEVTTGSLDGAGKLGLSSYELDSPAYWEKRFGFVPPALR
jgi:hypothetical protein